MGSIYDFWIILNPGSGSASRYLNSEKKLGYEFKLSSSGLLCSFFHTCFKGGILGRTSATGRGVPYTTPSDTLICLLFREVSMVAPQRRVAAYRTTLPLTLCYFFCSGRYPWPHLSDWSRHVPYTTSSDTRLLLLFRAVSMVAPQRRVAAYRTTLPLTLSYFFCSGRYP
jgi:hypothetical protein